MSTWKPPVEAQFKNFMYGLKYYFHVVFTIPDRFNQLVMANLAMFYTCMFRSAWTTLHKSFGKQGLQRGMTGILHTWGSNLFYYLHIH